MLYSTTYYLNHVTMTLYAAWEILSPFHQSELAQLSFTNLSSRIVSMISQVYCDFVLYFIVLMFQCFNVSCIIQHWAAIRNKPFFIHFIITSPLSVCILQQKECYALIAVCSNNVVALDMTVGHTTGWAKKTGLFLEVCNFRICWHRIAFYTSNCSVFYPE